MARIDAIAGQQAANTAPNDMKPSNAIALHLQLHRKLCSHDERDIFTLPYPARHRQILQIA